MPVSVPQSLAWTLPAPRSTPRAAGSGTLHNSSNGSDPNPPSRTTARGCRTRTARRRSSPEPALPFRVLVCVHWKTEQAGAANSGRRSWLCLSLGIGGLR